MQGENRTIELVAPAVLPLALAGANGAPQLLSVTLQHPPVHLTLMAGAALSVSGARADLAHTYARRFLERHALDQGVTIELELAIPSLMGLGSAPVLALAVGTGLAHWHGLALDEPRALAAATGLEPIYAPLVEAAAQGGLGLSKLAGAAGESLPRRPLRHPNRQAWAFVLVLPRAEPASGRLPEADRLRQLAGSAGSLDWRRAERATVDLLAALDHDDITQFGRALTELQQLGAASQPPLSAWEQCVCDRLRACGAVASGRSAGGDALYGLIQGDQASIAARQALRPLVAPEAGRVMAAITDNDGLRRVARR
jgi:predicted sugar kinase